MTGALLAALAVLAAAIPASPRRTRSVGGTPSAVAGVGGLVRRGFGRPADPAADRRVGVALLASVLGAVVHPLLGAVAAVGSLAVDLSRRRRLGRASEAAVRRELPEVIDLFALALAGGGSIHAAVERVGARPFGPVSTALAEASDRVAAGDRLASALESVAASLGTPARPFLRALVGAEHYGTTVMATLERLAVEARAHRRRHAQQAARRAPVKLLFPLVVAVLPAFVLLTIVPTLAGTFDGLRSGP